MLELIWENHRMSWLFRLVYTKVVNIGGYGTVSVVKHYKYNSHSFFYPSWQAGFMDKFFFTSLVP